MMKYRKVALPCRTKPAFTLIYAIQFRLTIPRACQILAVDIFPVGGGTDWQVKAAVYCVLMLYDGTPL